MNESTVIIMFLVVSTGVLLSALFMFTMIVFTYVKEKHLARHSAVDQANQEETDRFLAFLASDTQEVFS